MIALAVLCGKAADDPALDDTTRAEAAKLKLEWATLVQRETPPARDYKTHQKIQKEKSRAENAHGGTAGNSIGHPATCSLRRSAFLSRGQSRTRVRKTQQLFVSSDQLRTDEHQPITASGVGLPQSQPPLQEGRQSADLIGVAHTSIVSNRLRFSQTRRKPSKCPKCGGRMAGVQLMVRRSRYERVFNK